MVTKDNERYYILMKDSIEQESKIIINFINVSNNRTSKYIKQKNDRRNSFKIIVGNFNISFSTMDRKDR